MPNQIKCPNCGTVFTIDQEGYAEILRQVRTSAFEKEVEDRLGLLIKQQTMAYDQEIQRLKYQLQTAVSEKQTYMQASETDKKTALQLCEAQHQAEVNLLQQKYLAEMGTLKQTHDAQLRMKDEEIAYYKDFKARQSTKMVGESLEQHCQSEFNRYRMAMFPRAYFEKDNDARSGSKGDFIFRDYTETGMEFISIMFEMKNEMDTTATKHKNEDFLKELDKDRREKRCEYAVLVSMLEADSELYNTGIVDVSYRYPKMYVVRPQFFIPITTLLRGAALNAVSILQELTRIRNENRDFVKFENDLEEFKQKFSKNYDLAERQFEDAMTGIDRTIDYLQKVKSNLAASMNNMRLANNKAADLSVERLTKHNPAIRAKFEQAQNQ